MKGRKRERDSRGHERKMKRRRAVKRQQLEMRGRKRGVRGKERGDMYIDRTE